jgi:hypothetical protein
LAGKRASRRNSRGATGGVGKSDSFSLVMGWWQRPFGP